MISAFDMISTNKKISIIDHSLYRSIFSIYGYSQRDIYGVELAFLQLAQLEQGVERRSENVIVRDNYNVIQYNINLLLKVLNSGSADPGKAVRLINNSVAPISILEKNHVNIKELKPEVRTPGVLKDEAGSNLVKSEDRGSSNSNSIAFKGSGVRGRNISRSNSIAEIAGEVVRINILRHAYAAQQVKRHRYARAKVSGIENHQLKSENNEFIYLDETVSDKPVSLIPANTYNMLVSEINKLFGINGHTYKKEPAGIIESIEQRPVLPVLPVLKEVNSITLETSGRSNSGYDEKTNIKIKSFLERENNKIIRTVFLKRELSSNKNIFLEKIIQAGKKALKYENRQTQVQQSIYQQEPIQQMPEHEVEQLQGKDSPTLNNQIGLQQRINEQYEIKDVKLSEAIAGKDLTYFQPVTNEQENIKTEYMDPLHMRADRQLDGIAHKMEQMQYQTQAQMQKVQEKIQEQAARKENVQTYEKVQKNEQDLKREQVLQGEKALQPKQILQHVKNEPAQPLADAVFNKVRAEFRQMEKQVQQQDKNIINRPAELTGEKSRLIDNTSEFHGTKDLQELAHVELLKDQNLDTEPVQNQETGQAGHYIEKEIEKQGRQIQEQIERQMERQIQQHMEHNIQQVQQQFRNNIPLYEHIKIQQEAQREVQQLQQKNNREITGQVSEKNVPHAMLQIEQRKNLKQNQDFQNTIKNIQQIDKTVKLQEVRDTQEFFHLEPAADHDQNIELLQEQVKKQVISHAEKLAVHQEQQMQEQLAQDVQRQKQQVQKQLAQDVQQQKQRVQKQLAQDVQQQKQRVQEQIAQEVQRQRQQVQEQVAQEVQRQKQQVQEQLIQEIHQQKTQIQEQVERHQEKEYSKLQMQTRQRSIRKLQNEVLKQYEIYELINQQKQTNVLKANSDLHVYINKKQRDIRQHFMNTSDMQELVYTYQQPIDNEQVMQDIKRLRLSETAELKKTAVSNMVAEELSIIKRKIGGKAQLFENKEVQINKEIHVNKEIQSIKSTESIIDVLKRKYYVKNNESLDQIGLEYKSTNEAPNSSEEDINNSSSISFETESNKPEVKVINENIEQTVNMQKPYNIQNIQLDISKLADQVYKKLESRLRLEKQRRGMF